MPGQTQLPIPQSAPQAPAAAHSAARAYYSQGTDLLGQKRVAEAEFYLRQALRLNPDDADVLNNLGTAVWEQGRAPEAMAYYLRAYQFKPKDFGILNNLGIALWDQGRPERAVTFYHRALEIEPGTFDIQMNLGVALSDLGQFDEALIWLRSALALRPDSAEAWDNVGMTLARKGHWPEAMAHYDRAIELRPDFGEAHRNRALGWLSFGDFERGWPEAEWRLKCRNPPGFRVSLPLWTGEHLGGKTILLHWEQGLGDTLQFIRFAPQVAERGGRVWVFCQAPLARLVACCDGVDRVFDGTSPLPAIDTHAPLMSVPAILGTALSSLPQAPYLSADAATIDQWRGVLARALNVTDLESVYKVGIAWQGNPQNKIDRWRSFPLEMLAPLSEIAGVRLISLQKGPGAEQIRALCGNFPVAELDGGTEGREAGRDFLDTAAVMSLLDLVVTPETAVAHLAGALAMKCWVALCHAGDWRWMTEGDRTPWYSQTRLFRQTTMGIWDDVFRQMATALQTEAAARVARLGGNDGIP
jgi:tetratricopeptide (TPR) repeat protein